MTFAIFKILLEKLATDKNVSLRSLQAVITSYYKKIPIANFDCTHAYAVRASKNNNGETFSNISRCSYNPNSKSIPLQRCNYPEQKVFYCSIFSDTDETSTSMTCLAETGWEYIEDHNIPLSYFTVSRWRINKTLKLWALPFSKLGCEKNRDFERIKQNIILEISKKFTDTKEIIESLEYISDVFCKRENKKMYYRISSAYFNWLLFCQRYTGRPFDGLLYPSANTDGAGMNLVLKKELIDDKILNCDVATTYAMIRNPNDIKHLQFIPISNDSYPTTNGNLYFHLRIFSKKR